jgi:hypothetical protein
MEQRQLSGISLALCYRFDVGDKLTGSLWTEFI